MVLAAISGLLDYLGIRLTDRKPGRAELQLDVAPRHLNREATLQGGVIATLLDAACGYADLPREGDSQPGNVVTAMLASSYLTQVRQGRLTAIGIVRTSGHRLFFASGELVAERGTLIARTQGTFKAAKVQ
jgi:uncharacterized protein (TIGR00369 family)